MTDSYFTNGGLTLMLMNDFDAVDFRAVLLINQIAAATGKDYNFLDVVIAAGTEATCTGYSRKTLTGISVGENDAADEATLSFSSIAWGALGGASNCQISQLVIYRYNVLDADADVIAIVGAASGLPFTTDGSAVTSTTPTFTITSPTS